MIIQTKSLLSLVPSKTREDFVNDRILSRKCSVSTPLQVAVHALITALAHVLCVRRPGYVHAVCGPFGPAFGYVAGVTVPLGVVLAVGVRAPVDLGLVLAGLVALVEVSLQPV